MNLSAASIFVALCLGLAVGQVQLRVYRGTLVHSRVLEHIEVLRDYLLGFDENLGEILFVAPSSQLQALAQLHEFDQNDVITLPESQFLMPGLVCCHIHAEQVQNAGTHYDKTFVDWLVGDFIRIYLHFASNQTYARDVASSIVSWTLRHGTTTASYVAPYGVESAIEFVRVVGEQNQRVLVGREAVMNPAADQSADQAVNRTRRVIQFINDLQDPLIQPLVIVEPFGGASPELVQGMGSLARELDVGVQTHTAERTPLPNGTLQMWSEAGLLPPNKFVGYHGLKLGDSELEFFKQHNLSLAHNPNSNLNFASGILDVRKVLNMGIRLGLGLDISGGYSPSMFNAIRVAIHASKALSLTVSDPDYHTLTHHEAFYLATMGGAQALNMEDTIGNFEVGKQFDALLVDTQAGDGANPVFYTFPSDSMADIIEKFIYLSDDRNILRVFVAGRQVFPEPPAPSRVSLINDSPRVEGNNVTVDLRTDYPVQCSIKLAGTSTPLRNCSSTSFSFTNLTPDDNTPYVMRVVVRPSTSGSMKTTIRRQIWIPANPAICTVHLINDGVTVDGDTATVEFTSSGPATSFQCNLDRGDFIPCSSPHVFRDLSEGSHMVKIVPSGCGRNRRSVSTSFVV